MSDFGNNGESKFYLAVIGDLRQSREDPKREETQRLLERALESVNALPELGIASRFMITLGDEFQGLLSRPGSAIRLMAEIDRVMIGAPLRYGLGLGGLTTDLREQAVAMDGPCFHHAREAMEEAKRGGGSVVVRGYREEQDQAINRIFALLDTLRTKWKPVQEETVRLMRQHKLQKEVARIRGVPDSVVSEALKAAHYAQIAKSEEVLEGLLDAWAPPLREWKESS